MSQNHVFYVPYIVFLSGRFIFDAMHAVTGAYAKPIFVDKLVASPVCCVLRNGKKLSDLTDA